MTLREHLDLLRPRERALLAVGGPLLLIAAATVADWASAQVGGQVLPADRAPARRIPPPAAPGARA